MLKGTFYGALNARFLTPEEVARKFVPLPSFSRLVREDHSILMGPRGCGKTTLLKMLTRKALKTWQVSGRSEKYSSSFIMPTYESIYIPADARWLIEVNDVNAIKAFDSGLHELTQRVMITASVISEVSQVLKGIVDDIPSEDIDKEMLECKICESLIRLWGFKNTIPSFKDLALRVVDLMVAIRATLNLKDSSRLKAYMEGLPHILYSHSLDAAIHSCKAGSSILPKEICPTKWAICYDELEIAPPWLHTELLNSLRSIDQSFFLKLTWNPILPKATTIPEPGADFTIIRLWNSHVRDPVQFCDELTRAFLDERYPGKEYNPDEFLGHSIFASDEQKSDEHEYARGSVVYRAMKDLAVIDRSFRKALMARDIPPHDPIPSTDQTIRGKQLNEFFRKAKPIVLLRQAFLKEDGELRSRKSTTLYAGKEAIYAVSEGNPRWLLGLLNDISDSVDIPKTSGELELPIRFGVQATVVNIATRRFQALIKATPVVYRHSSLTEKISLHDLINGLANMFANALYDNEFPLDPIGSFKITKKISPSVEDAFRRAIEIGALVHIGRSPMDVPAMIAGERFRLSFMVCPSYKLPLRNYRHVRLEPAGIDKNISRQYRIRPEIAQLPLRFDEDEDIETIEN